MGYSIGYDERWSRDIGYGVPAVCDHPDCSEAIDRGLSYVCGSEPYGGEDGCGLFFCGNHLPLGGVCERCAVGAEPFVSKPDVAQWVNWKLTDDSWREWRSENPDDVARLTAQAARS